MRSSADGHPGDEGGDAQHHPEGVSEDVSRLRLAREALDVETTAQAVLKAAFYNQMFVIETPDAA